MKKSNLISIIMSVYNDDKYLEESIKSILFQTYINWELIIIDDYSTDNSKNIIKKYINKDKRIKLLENDKNKGLPKSLNKGIRHSSGNYIVRMDADDISKNIRLEKQLNFIKKNSNVDVLGSGAEIIDINNKKLGIIKMEENHSEIIKNISSKNIFFHPSVMIKKSFFNKVGFYNENLRKGQDLELWIRGINLGAIYHNLNYPLIEYRYNNKVLSIKNIVHSFNTYIYIAFNHGPIIKWLFIGLFESIKKIIVKLKLYKPSILR